MKRIFFQNSNSKINSVKCLIIITLVRQIFKVCTVLRYFFGCETEKGLKRILKNVRSFFGFGNRKTTRHQQQKSAVRFTC